MRCLFLHILLLNFIFIGIGKSQNIKGLSFVAPRNPFEKDPMPEIASLNADWIAIIPYGFSYKNDPVVHYSNKGHWWGESPEGVEKTIELAKANCLKIMLKPQVYIPGGWVGDMSFESETQWKKWEESYARYIWQQVEFAIAHDIEMICIGTEYRKAANTRIDFWRSLVSDIRKVYSGMLTYGANWDDYQQVPFWDALDFIGVSAYFPLSEAATPNKKVLTRKWRPIVKELDSFSKKTNKKILFTEFGYMGVDKCAWKCWELEKYSHSLSINEEAQNNALDAIFEVFWEQDFWAGGFLWKWFPNLPDDYASAHKDYTPQGKLALSTIKSWYNKD